MKSASNQQIKKILFAVQEYGEFLEFERLFPALLQGESVIAGVWFLKASYRTLGEHSKRAREEGLFCLDSEGNHLSESVGGLTKELSTKRNNSADDRLPKAWKRQAIDGYNFCCYLVRISKRFHRIMKCLRTLRPDCIVVGQEPVGTELSLICHAGKRLEIPVVMIPFAWFNTEVYTRYAAKRKERNRNYSVLNWLVGRYFPHWCTNVGPEVVLRLPGWQICALELARLGQSNPWAIGAGPVNVIASESTAQRGRYESRGVPAKKLKITGAAVHDVLAKWSTSREKTRSELRRLVDADDTAPVVFCAWPPNIFPWANYKTPEFDNYDQVTSEWCRVLREIQSKTGALIVVKPHPKSLREEIKRIYSEPFYISNEDTAYLLSAADLFLTTMSSVITWALTVPVPTINYDCFGTGYSDFDGLAGIIKVQLKEEFRSISLELSGDSTKRQHLRHEMMRYCNNWGVLDGNSVERILHLLFDFCGASKSSELNTFWHSARQA